jgi:hypothetical protein
VAFLRPSTQNACGQQLQALMHRLQAPFNLHRGPLLDSQRHLTFSFHQVVSSPVVVRKAVARGMFFLEAL